MGRKVYISFKAEDIDYKTAIQEIEGLDYVDKSLNVPIDSTDEDYIMQKIRSDYLSDSTVTIHLIGLYGAESRGSHEQRFIKRELQASLYNSAGNTKSGILGIVLPAATTTIYRGSYTCRQCGGSHNHVAINDQSTISEFSHNYYIPHNKCAHSEEDRYCVLTKWEDFVADPQTYIEAAYAKRTAPIASKTKVRP
jgi:hypothetical protein